MADGDRDGDHDRDDVGPASPGRRALIALAGGLVVVGTIGAAASAWRSRPVGAESHTTARGERRTVTLADGSTVLLDAETTLSFTAYRDRRELGLQHGQALFDVAPDAGRPLRVRAGDTTLTALGTRFVMRHTPGQRPDGVQVGVLEGRVQVVRNAGRAPGAVELAAGQSLRAVPDAPLPPATPGVPAAWLAWRDGHLDFDAVPLGQVLQELARYGDPGVRFPEPAVARLPVSARVPLDQVDRFAARLPALLPVRLAPDGAGRQAVVARADEPQTVTP